MNRILKASLLIAVCYSASLSAYALEKSRSFEALGTTRTVLVEFDVGKEAWADYILAKSTEFLAAASRYLGAPVPQTTTLLIRGKDEVLFDLPGFAWSGKPIGGSNYGDRIEISYALSEPGKPALLYHELGHYWFGSSKNDSSVNWLYEGIVSFLPLAIASEGLLHIDESEEYWIEAHWQEGESKDAPLESDIRNNPKDSSFALFYAKSFRIQKVLAYYLGYAGYKKLLKALLPNQLGTNTEILTLLGTIKKLDWKAALAGWVFGPDYTHTPKDSVLDTDSDGLTGLEERAAGTDPLLVDTDKDGLSDGVEVEFNLDPLRPIDPALRKNYLAKAGIRIDGLSSDWEGKGRVVIVDPALDVKRTAAAGAYKLDSFDIVKTEVAIRGDFFHVLVSTKDLPARALGVMFDCMIDTDGDFWPDMEFAFRLDKPREAWSYTAKDKRSSMSPLYTGAVSECIEMRFPISDLPDSFYILVIIRDEKEAQNLDEGNAWFRVSLFELKSVERFALETDLRSSDNDADGIPDRDELALGLDPLKKNPASDLARYGPFVDGYSSDWSGLPFKKFIDKVGESGEADIDWFGYYEKGGQSYFLVTLKTPPVALSGKSFHLNCDLDGDGTADREFSFFLDASETPWIFENKTGSSRTSAAIRASVSKQGVPGCFCIELCVPSELLKGSSLHVYPIIRDMEGAFNYDEFGSWLSL